MQLTLSLRTPRCFRHLTEGDIGICGVAVLLSFFGPGVAVHKITCYGVAVISNCAVCGVQCSVKQNYLQTLCGVVVYCNSVLTINQCPPPYGQELNPPVYKKTKKKCVEITPATSDSYNPLFWKMN